MSAPVGRFAPSITGSAHPGTLLAGLLCWLDARSLAGRVVMRLEDCDNTRLRAGQREEMQEAMAWLGLDWDEVQLQSQQGANHDAALDKLHRQGRLYPCGCSRSRLKQVGRLAPGGGFAYDNHCRDRAMPSGGWRECSEPLRYRLGSKSGIEEKVTLVDEGGCDLSQTPGLQMGDPIVRRRDGAIAYHLASVVDDANSNVTRVVRGRDLATSTATQILLQDSLCFEHPTYRHHLLLLENHKSKLSKLHASAPYPELKTCTTGPQLCGHLAMLCGLRNKQSDCHPSELLAEFDWKRVTHQDLLYRPMGLQSPER